MRLLALALFLCLVASNACARDYMRSARSGQLTRMAVYRSWTIDCKNKRGVVTVVSKPAHGTLRPSEIQSTIGASRYHPEVTAHCQGLPTNGFRVDYISNPGFHGTDQFVIQVEYGHGPDIDHFSVDVQ